MEAVLLYSSLWAEPWFVPYSADGKYLFLYFTTNAHKNPAGLYSVPLNVVCAETGLDPDRVTAAAAEINDRCCYDPPTGAVWVRNFLAVHGRSETYLKAAFRAGMKAQEKFKKPFLERYAGLLGTLPEFRAASVTVARGYRGGSDTALNGLGNGLGNGLQEPPATKRRGAGKTVSAPGPPEQAKACPWCINPTEVTKESLPAPQRLAQVYHDAYKQRHGDCPVLEKKDWAALKRLLKEVRRFDRIAAVIRHGVASEDEFIRSNGHRVAIIATKFQGIAQALDRGEKHGARTTGRAKSSNLIERGHGRRAAESWARQRERRGLPPVPDAGAGS